MIMCAALSTGHPDPVNMDSNDLKEVKNFLKDRKRM